jgi:hypothetical protein
MAQSSWYPSPQSAPPATRSDLRIESPAHLAGLAVVLWLAGVLIHPLAMLVPVAILLLVLAGVAYLIRPRAQTMYWRGRRLELDPNLTPAQRLYRRVFKH